MIDTDELEPIRPTPQPRDLEAMSITMLEEYITELEAEINRARAEIEKKSDARAGAEAFFKR